MSERTAAGSSTAQRCSAQVALLRVAHEFTLSTHRVFGSRLFCVAVGFCFCDWLKPDRSSARRRVCLSVLCVLPTPPHRTALHCTALRCTAESYTELERFNKITICDTHDRCGGARCSGLIDPNPPTTSCVSAAAAAAAGDCCPSLLRSFVFYLIVCPPPCSSPFPPPPPPPPPPAFLLLLRLSLLQITPLVRAWSLACVRGGAGAGVSPFLLVVAAFSVFTCLALQDRILNLALSLTRTGTRTGTLSAPAERSERPPAPSNHDSVVRGCVGLCAL